MRTLKKLGTAVCTGDRFRLRRPGDRSCRNDCHGHQAPLRLLSGPRDLFRAGNQDLLLALRASGGSRA